MMTSPSKPQTNRMWRPLFDLWLSVLLLTTFTAAFAAQGGATPERMRCEGVSETLSRRIGLELESLFNVIDLEESAGRARLRIVAQVGPTQVLQRLEAALGNAWVRQPTPTTLVGGGATHGVASLLSATPYYARYLHKSLGSLRVTVQPIGRSNLFWLELRLFFVPETPTP